MTPDKLAELEGLLSRLGLAARAWEVQGEAEGAVKLCRDAAQALRELTTKTEHQWKVIEGAAALNAERMQALRAASEREARLREALEKIDRVRYGLDVTDSPEEARDYWSDLVAEYRKIARAALAGEQSSPSIKGKATE